MPARTASIVAVLLLFAPPGATAQSARPDANPLAPRDADARGSGVIRGRVIDAVTGEAIARAVVRLRVLGPGTGQWDASASDDGSFEFSRLPGGSFKLVAEPPPGSTSHVSRSYGHSVRFDPLRIDPGGPLRLSGGDEVTAVIELPRARTIAGRILVPEGRAAQGVKIALKDPNGYQIHRTDVRSDAEGRFRFAGLRPGEYRVCAVPGMDPVLVRSTGRFEGPQILETCQPAPLGSSDLSAVEIPVRYGSVYSIAGSIVDSTGAPVRSDTLQLTRKDGPDSTAIDIRRTANQFSIRGVPPGEYLLSARRMASEWTAAEMGFAVVRVGDADVDQVVVRTWPPVSITGRIEFAEGTPAAMPKVNVNTVGERVRKPGPSENLSHVRGDLTFQLDGLFGPQLVQVFGAMRPRAVSSIRYRGEEIFGRAVDLRSSADPGELVVTLTSRSASVTPRLRVAGRQPSSGNMVALIAVDPATGAPLENALFRPIDAEGPFGLPVVRPGDYLIAALALEDASGPPASLVPRIARVASRIRLAPDEHRVIELDLVRPK